MTVPPSDRVPFQAGFPFWLGLALLMTAPFLLAPIPPLPDFPGHVAQYHIMLNLHRSAQLQAFYDFRWTLAGNLGADLLMLLAGPMLGVERAAWAIAAATPALMIAGIFAVSCAVHGRVQIGAFMALPFVYARAFMWGFVNYDLSVALALLAFALWLKWQGLPRALGFCLIAPALWVCHAVGWGLLCLLVGSYELQAALRREGWRFSAIMQSTIRVVPLLPPLLLSALMLQRSKVPNTMPATISDLPTGSIFYKFVLFFDQLHDRIHILDVGSIFLVGAFYAFARRRGAAIAPALAVPAVLIAAATLLLPYTLNGSVLADYRIAPVAIMIFLMSVSLAKVREGRWIAAAALLLTFVRLTVTAFGWHQDAMAYDRHLSALRSVPMGARILVLVPLDTERPYRERPLGHLADLAVVRRDALVNSQWMNDGAIPLQIKVNANSSYYADPSQFLAPAAIPRALTYAHRDHFDFVWILGRFSAGPVPDHLVQTYADEESRLFRVER